MIAMMHVVSPRVVFGEDLVGAMAAQVWDKDRQRWLYIAVFDAARRGVILDPWTGARRWHRDVGTLPELIASENRRRMVKNAVAV